MFFLSGPPPPFSFNLISFLFLLLLLIPFLSKKPVMLPRSGSRLMYYLTDTGYAWTIYCYELLNIQLVFCFVLLRFCIVSDKMLHYSKVYNFLLVFHLLRRSAVLPLHKSNTDRKTEIPSDDNVELLTILKPCLDVESAVGKGYLRLALRMVPAAWHRGLRTWGPRCKEPKAQFLYLFIYLLVYLEAGITWC